MNVLQRVQGWKQQNQVGQTRTTIAGTFAEKYKNKCAQLKSDEMWWVDSVFFSLGVTQRTGRRHVFSNIAVMLSVVIHLNGSNRSYLILSNHRRKKYRRGNRSTDSQIKGNNRHACSHAPLFSVSRLIFINWKNVSGNGCWCYHSHLLWVLCVGVQRISTMDPMVVDKPHWHFEFYLFAFRGGMNSVALTVAPNSC